MPGVRIRGNEVDLPESTYILMIDEIPIASGTVRKNQLFVPDQLKELEQLNLSPGDMEQQLGGTWVDQNFKAELNEMNLEFWEDPFRHIIYHLKIQLIERLDFLYDLQMTFNYLNELDELPAHIKRIAEAIREDDNLLILFDKVLRGLLEERVAVKNKTAIINNFADLDPTTDHYLCIQQIRLILKSILPGNNPILEKINLPENIEQKIHDAMHNDGDKNFLAMEPVICQEVLTEIREMVSNYRLRDIVLEVNNTKLRPFVRNLIKIEFRDLLTIASEEVI
jgi:flagellar biosynthesis component FlhA